jgi:NTP pyrophosphatase (non-canonical NTP hydrolase)
MGRRKKLNFNEYQERALDTAQYPTPFIKSEWEDNSAIPMNNGIGYVYPALGLVGEAGEVAEKVKKLIRDCEGVPTADRVEDIKKELGDVLWYLAVLANEFDIKLEDIATLNLSKLASRKKRNKIKGDGDNR